jgi:hypothetical protein
MLENIIKLLNLRDYFNVSEFIEIAKGKYKIPKTIKEKSQQVKREQKWQQKK